MSVTKLNVVKKYYNIIHPTISPSYECGWTEWY